MKQNTLITVLALAAVGFIGWRIWEHRKEKNQIAKAKQAGLTTGANMNAGGNSTDTGAKLAPIRYPVDPIAPDKPGASELTKMQNDSVAVVNKM